MEWSPAPTPTCAVSVAAASERCTRARTGTPASTSRSTTMRPAGPVAPVTSTGGTRVGVMSSSPTNPGCCVKVRRAATCCGGRREARRVAPSEARPAGLSSRLTSSDSTGLPASRFAAYAVQLSDLDQIAAGVIRLGDGRARHLCGRHLEFGGVFHPFVVTLDVIRVEHDRGLALLEERLLVSLGRGVVIALEMQLGAIRLLRRRHSEPAIPTLRNVHLLHEAGHLCVEAQGLVEVVHVKRCEPGFRV